MRCWTAPARWTCGWSRIPTWTRTRAPVGLMSIIRVPARPLCASAPEREMSMAALIGIIHVPTRPLCTSVPNDCPGMTSCDALSTIRSALLRGAESLGSTVCGQLFEITILDNDLPGVRVGDVPPADTGLLDSYVPAAVRRCKPTPIAPIEPIACIEPDILNPMNPRWKGTWRAFDTNIQSTAFIFSTRAANRRRDGALSSRRALSLAPLGRTSSVSCSARSRPGRPRSRRTCTITPP